jgi:hypothetical protein
VQAVALVQPAQRRRRPPVGAAQQLHRGGHEQRPDDRGVDEDRERQADTHRLDVERPAGGERPEDHADEQRRRRDDPARALQTVGDRGVVVAGAVPLLLDAGQQEHLVVHREPEDEHEQQQRRREVQRAGEEHGQHADGRQQRQQVQHDRLQRDEHRAREREQQQRGRDEDDEQREREPFAGGVLGVDQLRRRPADEQ